MWDLFVAAMAWGYGDRPYGPARVARILAASGPETVRTNLTGLTGASRQRPAEAWNALRTTHRTKWLGPAFATKVAYFAAFSSADPPAVRPLIADANTSWAMWHLCGIPRSAERRSGYLDYVATAHRWADENGWRPDEVERAVFEIGKILPHA
ncbi:hypothetical protein BH23ACT8_BH23ACT8_03170 [soil metagenome]